MDFPCLSVRSLLKNRSKFRLAAARHGEDHRGEVTGLQVRQTLILNK
jgi:hypothetical protein